MIAKSIRAASLGAAISVVAALAGAGSAQAAVYRGTWDPGYGGIFPTLGWSASASFDVPTSCLTTDGPKSISGDCAGFSVLSAQLDFYNTASPSTILESFSLNTGVFVNGIVIAGGQLAGINTGFFGAVVPSGDSLSIAGGGNYAFSLILYDNTFAQLVRAKPTTTSPACAALPSTSTDCAYSANAAVGTITPAIPEPQTYALMLAGLGALGWVARRRNRQATTA